MAERKLPSFQFYPGDWRKDPNLARCSKAAKGVWIDLICLMFECDDRGVLATGGVPWSDEEIAAAVGGDPSEVMQCLRELELKGVAHRNTFGALFCKRLVRDEQIRRVRSEAGKKGGNPVLLKQKRSKPEARGQPKNGSSSSSSSSTSVEDPPLPPELATDEFRAKWREWLGYRRQHGWTTKPIWAERQLASLAEHGPMIAAEALDLSMRNGWQAVVPENVRHGNGNQFFSGGAAFLADGQG